MRQVLTSAAIGTILLGEALFCDAWLASIALLALGCFIPDFVRECRQGADLRFGEQIYLRYPCRDDCLLHLTAYLAEGRQ